jgi:hypothetical protein
MQHVELKASSMSSEVSGQSSGTVPGMILYGSCGLLAGTESTAIVGPKMA